MRWLCLAVALACAKAHPHAPAGDGCNTDADCVAVVGNPCSPCGHCPYEPTQIMTKAALARLMAADWCPERDQEQHPDWPPPSCSPCEGGHGEAPRPAAACVAHACVAK